MEEELNEQHHNWDVSVRSAAASGRVDELKKLLDTARPGTSINKQLDSTGDTPLHLACKHNHPETVLALLSRGADVNIQDKKGSSSLHVACDCIEVAEMLLKNPEINVNTRNHKGYSALDISLKRNKFDIATTLLAHRDQEIAARDRTTADAIHNIILLMTSPHRELGSSNHLLRRAFHFLAAWGSAEDIQRSLDDGAGLQYQNRSGQTALDCARSHANVEVEAFLVRLMSSGDDPRVNILTDSVDLVQLEHILLQKLSEWKLLRTVQSIHKVENKLIVFSHDRNAIRDRLTEELQDELRRACVFPENFSEERYLATKNIEIGTRIVQHASREDAWMIPGGCISFFAQSSDGRLFVITCLHVFFKEKFLKDTYLSQGTLLRIPPLPSGFLNDSFKVWAFPQHHGITLLSEEVFGLFGPYPSETRGQLPHVFLDIAALPVLPTAHCVCKQILKDLPHCTLAIRDITEPQCISVAGTCVQKFGPKTNTTYGHLLLFNDTIVSGDIPCSTIAIRESHGVFADNGDSGAAVMDDLRGCADGSKVQCHGILRSQSSHSMDGREDTRYLAVDCAEALSALQKEFGIQLTVLPTA